MMKSTVFACLAAIVLAIVPGYFLGELVAGIYAYLMSYLIGDASAVMRTVAVDWLAGLIAGIVIGHIAIAPTRHVLKQANIMLAAHSVSVFAIAVGALVIYLILSGFYPGLDAVAIAARTAGVVLAAYQAARGPTGTRAAAGG